MKTIFKLLPVFLAAAVPASMAAELAGFPLPAGADFISLFSAFVATLVTLTAVGDYSRPRRDLTILTRVTAEKSSNPLAA